MGTFIPNILYSITTREAFYGDKESLPLSACEGKVSGTSVMCYPPGIPILAPGEEVTKKIVLHILHAAEKGCAVTGLSKDGDLVVLK